VNKPPIWFFVVAAVALLWNVAGLAAVAGDLRLSASDIAALAPAEQAARAARPGWSVVGSVLAVAAGTLGCVLLLLRKRLASVVLAASLVGVVIQDIGIFLFAGAGSATNLVPFVLQGLVLAVAVALLLLSRRAQSKAWLA
jgi:hypothetical protein